eukprot:1783936-Prymnesium_polylepis.1
MASNLMSAGHELVVFDLNTAAVEALVAKVPNSHAPARHHARLRAITLGSPPARCAGRQGRRIAQGGRRR